MNLTSELGTGVIVGLKPAATWGTAVQAVADDGFYARTFDIQKSYERTAIDHLNAAAVESPAILGAKKFVLNMSMWGNYRSGLPQLLGSLMGAETVADIDTAAPVTVGGAHQFIAQQAATRMMTVAAYYPRRSLVKELTTAIVTELTLSDSPGGGLQVSAVLWAHDYLRSNTDTTTNTTASMSSTLTIPDPLDVPSFNDLVLRIAAHSASTPLASGDQFAHDGYTLSLARPLSDRVDGSTRPLRAHPQTNGHVTAELTLPRAGLDDMALEDFLRGADKDATAISYAMADLTYSGPLLTGGDAGQVHRVASFLPYLEPQSHEDAVSGAEVIPESITFASKLAPANGTFDARVPYAEVDNELQTVYYS